MSDKVQSAVETYQTTGFNCAQSVLSEFAEQFGMDMDTAMKIACGFGSGIGRSGNVCGAVTGGMLVLGLKYGMDDPGSEADKEKTYEKALILLDRIMAIHSSTNCTDLMGVDLGTPEGLLQAQEQELSDKICSKLVGDVTRILEELLEPRNRD